LPKPEEMGNFQIEGNRNLEIHENNFKNYMHKNYFGNDIAKMHCVVHFIMFVHNMPPLMLDLRFKTFHLMSSLIGHEQGETIVEKMIRNLYFKYNC
jgi:hypothetical protein